MKELIRKTLERDFDFQQYVEFIKNFFNEIQLQPQEIRVPDGSKEFIKKITFLADFCDSEKKNIDVYAVELVGGTKVERARSFQRNLISKLLKDNTKDAGLVAFYSKDNPDWRLSFIKLEYKLTEKGVKVEVGTPPKRYSFLVGTAEPSHTAQKQLLPILEDHKNNPLLSDIEEAFSVEKVTKEFYEKYRKLFEDLSKDLKKNKAFQVIAEKENIDIDNFTKKLLGQIVFLYFLQKKGWLGVPQDKTWGQGDKFFLRTLFNKAKQEKKDFYDGYLEPLFYDTLNNPRSDEVDPSYSKYFDCKIPFLNGGLFEPDYDWKNTIVYLGNDIFKEIIETFDLYNFTVKEDEPLEKEVAVDPEMLGKVFENLLPENMRKGQGAYYTPREIVHYMCQESLINHLSTETKVDIEKIRKLITSKDNIISEIEEKPKGKVLTLWENETELLDKALSNIKVCDPACGSGAFLVGMLNEIVSARRILEPRSEYKLKKEIIQNCIYGVDIDPGAVDIAKLRLWLTLVVDFELRDIEPLPNLDYKIMCGNSLLEELIIGDESIKLFDERLLGEKLTDNDSTSNHNEGIEKQIKEKERELQEIKSFNARLTRESMQKAKEIEKAIKALKKNISLKSSGDKHTQDDFYKQKGHYFEDLRALHKQYFTEYDPIRKKEKRQQIEAIELKFIKSSIKEKVDEIDTQIRNLNMQKTDERKKQTGLMKKKLEYQAIPEQIHESKAKPYFLWKLNFFEVFQEKGGFDVVIANPPYISYGLRGAQTMEDNYKYILKNLYPNSAEYKISMYAIFMDRALQLCSNNGMQSFIVPDSFLVGRYFSKVRREMLSKNKIIEILLLPYAVFEATVGFSVVYLFQRSNDNKNNRLITKLTNSNSEITDRSFYSFSYLQSYYEKLKYNRFRLFFNKETMDLVNKISSNCIILGDIADFNSGLIGKDGKNSIVSNAKKSKDWLPGIISGGEIQKYILKPEGNFLLYKKEKIHSGYECVDYFEDKMFMRQTGDSLICALDDIHLLCLNNVHVGNLKNRAYFLEYIVAIINSSLLNYYYRALSCEYGRAMAQTDIETIEDLPIKEVTDIQQKPFIDLVKKIITITKDDDYLTNSIKQAKVKEYERQIDQMVYELYGLTKKEIEIIEQSVKDE